MPENKGRDKVCYIIMEPILKFPGSPWPHYGLYKDEKEAAKALRERGWEDIRRGKWMVTDKSGKKNLTAEIHTIWLIPRNQLPRGYPK